MALIELIEKDADKDLAAEQLMEAEVEAWTGAAHGDRNTGRIVERNGYRERGWDTRAGRVELEIPKPRRTAERALTAVIQKAYVHDCEIAANSDPLSGVRLCEWTVWEL